MTGTGLVSPSLRGHFDQVAARWDLWRRRNAYYRTRIQELVRGMVPPGSRVLELGTLDGDLLASLEPSQGVGLCLSSKFAELAADRHPGLRFIPIGARLELPAGFSPDHVVLTGIFDYTYDVADLVSDLRRRIDGEALLLITANNPLWAPLLRLASLLRQRIPDAPINLITNRDIRNVLETQSLRVVEEGLIAPVPKRLPLLGPLLNALLPELPVLRYSSSVQYLAARPQAPRPPLSCSVVIPCHNEEDNIAECVRRVPRIGSRTEIIVVDDGSTDGTRAKVLELMRSDKRVRLVAADRNQGKASAVHAGFSAATCDALVILDADMTVHPEDLPRFFAPIQDGIADFINGTRLVYPMEGRAMKLANYLGNKAFCFLASWVLRQRVSDTLCGTKALLKRHYAQLPWEGKERWGDFDFLFGAARLRLRIIEVPIHYFERRAGRSKMRVLYDGWLFLKACWNGWRLLRFPDRRPWPKERRPAPEFREISA